MDREKVKEIYWRLEVGGILNISTFDSIGLHSDPTLIRPRAQDFTGRPYPLRDTSSYWYSTFRCLTLSRPQDTNV